MSAKKSDSSSAQLSFFAPDMQENDEAYENDEENNSRINRKADIDKSAPSERIGDFEDEMMTDAEVQPEHTVKPQKVETERSEPPSVSFDEKKKPHKHLDFKYENSAILTFLAFIGAAISKAFRNSFTVAIFTAYQRMAVKFKESFLYNLLFNPKTQKLSISAKKNIRKIATVAYIPAMISKFFNGLMCVKTRVYGISLLSFGISTLLANMFIARNFDIFNHDVYAPITGSIILVASIFLLMSSKIMVDAIKESFILSTLLFEFLGIKRPAFSEDEEVNFPVSAGLLIGLLLGLLTLFVPAHTILMIVMTVIYTFVVVKYPETGIISLILIIPIINNTALVYICTVISISYVFKLLTGKRSASFEFSDIFVIIFLLMTIFSDIVSFGTQNFGFTSSAFILVYFICICTLRDPTWFQRAINSIMLGAFIFAAYSVLVSFLGKNLGLNLDYSAITDYGSTSAGAFGSVSVLSVILICSVFYLLASAFTTRSKSNRFAYILVMLAAMLFIFREASITLKFAFSIVLIMFFILRTSKTVVFIVLAFAVIPLLPLFNPTIYSGIASLLRAENYRLDIWNAVINMMASYGFTGIGNATDAFSQIYASFYVGNTATVPHAHSLLFQISISLGIVGILIFLIIAFFILQGAFSYGRNCPDKNSKNRFFCYAGMCSVAVLIITGIGEYIWYNPRIMLVFWLFCGLTVCARRSAKDLTASDEILLELEENYNG